MQDMLQQIGPLIPALRRYARTLLRDRSAADDLVQDCLVRAVKHWSTRRSPDARPWIFAILHNLAVTRLRSISAWGHHVGIEDANEDAFVEAPSQENGLRYRELLSALDCLPEEQKTVLLLTAVEELSYNQAADVLGIPLGTVMSRLFRARERLSKEIERQGRPKLAVLRRIK